MEQKKYKNLFYKKNNTKTANSAYCEAPVCPLCHHFKILNQLSSLILSPLLYLQLASCKYRSVFEWIKSFLLAFGLMIKMRVPFAIREQSLFLFSQLSGLQYQPQLHEQDGLLFTAILAPTTPNVIYLMIQQDTACHFPAVFPVISF